MDKNSPRLLDHIEAAKALRMLPARIKRLAKRGLIPHVDLLDGEIRFAADDLEEFIDSHRVLVMEGNHEA